MMYKMMSSYNCFTIVSTPTNIIIQLSNSLIQTHLLRILNIESFGKFGKKNHVTFNR